MKLTGRVVFRDIETGVWVLEGDDGRTYQLAGGDRKIKKDGQRVEVEGKVDRRRDDHPHGGARLQRGVVPVMYLRADTLGRALRGTLRGGLTRFQAPAGCLRLAERSSS